MLSPWYFKDTNVISSLCSAPLTKASNYIDGGMEIKEAYTREEIAEIKDQVLAGYKKIKGVSSLTKKR